MARNGKVQWAMIVKFVIAFWCPRTEYLSGSKGRSEKTALVPLSLAELGVWGVGRVEQTGGWCLVHLASFQFALLFDFPFGRGEHVFLSRISPSLFLPPKDRTATVIRTEHNLRVQITQSTQYQ
jgi:hypothetical protein